MIEEAERRTYRKSTNVRDGLYLHRHRAFSGIENYWRMTGHGGLTG